MIRTISVFIALILFSIKLCFAATYYISPTGNDITGNGTNGNPWATLNRAIPAMSGGDTLICKDGTYTGDNNRLGRYIRVPPVGSPGAYTIIKAENDGKAVFDGENTRNMFYVEYPSGEAGNRYWQFEGLVWCRPANSTVDMHYCSYVKFLRCGAYDAATNNNVNFGIARSSYVLLEGCYAYGSGRYKFLSYRSNNIILRNCVGRMDWVNAGNEPVAIFSIYSGADIKVQNCIGIDSSDTSNWSTTGGYEGTFFYPSTDANLDRVETIRCLGLKNRLGGIKTSGNESMRAADLTFTDCAIWDCDTVTGNSITVDRALNSIFNRCTFGYARNINFDYLLSWDGIGYNNNSTVKNSIFYSIQGNASYGVLNDVENCNYNSFYDNTRNYLNTTPGANDRTTINPIYHATTNPTGALKYITRIEAGSNLAGIGESGSNIGATLSTLVGTPGTLWGEAGYNTDTGVSMWPFPNEDIIRTNMKAYNGGGVSGNRGFCADGTTLTKYIWEYLGNAIPADIYGLRITTDSLSSSLINSTYTQFLQAENGTIPYSWSILSGTIANGLSLNSITGEISGIPTVAGTYSFIVKCTDSTAAEDTQSLSIVVNAQGSSGGGGGGGGCLIATASYGSKNSEEVQILTKFRDEYLLTHKFGRGMVKLYYKLSPPIANYIKDKSWARNFTKGILKPIVRVIKDKIK